MADCDIQITYYTFFISHILQFDRYFSPCILDKYWWIHFNGIPLFCQVSWPVHHILPQHSNSSRCDASKLFPIRVLEMISWNLESHSYHCCPCLSASNPIFMAGSLFCCTVILPHFVVVAVVCFHSNTVNILTLICSFMMSKFWFRAS